MSNKVAIYVRVSTLEQAEHGYSVGEQISKLEKYCDVRGWHVYDQYVDGGFSGSNIDRPGIDRLVSDAKSKKFDLVLVYKLDRLSRSQKDTLFLIEDVFSANGVDFVSINENFDTSTAFGKAMIGILSVFAQLEREQIKERMTLGKLGRAKSGKTTAWTKVPFGYDYNPETGALELNPIQAVVVKSIFDDYLAGTSVTKLRDHLNEAGHVGKDRAWSYRSLRFVLDNQVYAGYVRFGDQLFDGLHEAIVSRETFDAVQLELIKRQQTAAKKFNPRPFKAKYMLSGAARCGYCGAPMSTVLRNKKKDGTRQRIYQCVNRFPRKTQGVTVYNDNKKCDSGFYLMDEIEAAVIGEVAKLQTDPAALDGLLSSNEAPVVDLDALKKQAATVDSKIKKLTDLYMNDLLSLDDLKSRTENLQADKKLIEAKIREVEASDSSAVVSNVQAVLGSGLISSLDYEGQKRVVNQLIEKVDVTAETVRIHWKF
jgi:site-specific DNA recombinase